LQDGQIVGIGSGTTIVSAVERIGRLDKINIQCLVNKINNNQDIFGIKEPYNSLYTLTHSKGIGSKLNCICSSEQFKNIANM